MAKLLYIFKIPELRNKLLITLGLIIVYRIGNYLPLPGIDYNNIKRYGEIYAEQTDSAQGKLMALYNLFSGGAMQNVALFALGIMPYISASIITQLMTKIIPSWEQMVKEGQAGRDRISAYTRYLTVLLCIIQGYVFLKSLIYNPINIPGGGGTFYLVAPGDQTFFFSIKTLTAMTAGTMFTMWLADQITTFGIGQGASLIIMLGIIGRMPAIVADLFGQAQAGLIEPAKPILLMLIYVLIIAAVIFITQGQRRLPIQYAKHTRGRRVYGMSQRAHFPIRVNMAGVMPVIFASSLMIFPGIILGLLPQHMAIARLGDLFHHMAWTYLTVYVVAVFFFSYFWNGMMFNPTEQADRMKEIGAFIPGFTPGPKTGEYFDKIMNRMTLAGAAFLAGIAILPDVMAIILQMNLNMTQVLGGTGLLIVAGVALDVVTKIESHLVMRNYEGFLKSGRVRGRR